MASWLDDVGATPKYLKPSYVAKMAAEANGTNADGAFADEWGRGGSRHAGAEAIEGDGGKDDICKNCGKPGHFSRDCEEPRSIKCYNCNQEGHGKSECPNPRVFTGTCKGCGKEGHRISDCPDKPPEVCRNCKEEGHKAMECTANRVIDIANIPDKSAEQAWADLLRADKERDLDDLRDAVQVYHKAKPDSTYRSIEEAFRFQKFQTYIIAYEKEVTDTFTLMDMNGKLDCKYHVGFFFSPNPIRVTMKDSWPKSPEENLERLLDAGVPVERGVPKCSNCDALGHTSRGCPEEKVEKTDRVEVKCIICEEVGHRARDCAQERVDKFACRNCKQSGHTSKECPEPRSAEGVECKNCNEMGHFSRDCPKRQAQPCHNCGEEGHRARDCEKPRVDKCRNCDEEGHKALDCPKPRDWSRVKCMNCGEMGHGRGRCKAPPKEETNGAFDPGVDESGFAGVVNNANDAPAASNHDTAAGDGDWGSGATAGDGDW